MCNASNWIGLLSTVSELSDLGIWLALGCVIFVLSPPGNLQLQKRVPWSFSSFVCILLYYYYFFFQKFLPNFDFELTYLVKTS